ncbi:hypothetical protein RT761_01745 [Atribacter laminatus]|jgi:hypothetical protein|uniref:Uncharacterized protein n=1 Tax=Atribacter laminatus TaxID=2847778 RepID=A0A7T1AMB9_ATRLM|nr:hypothetical protein RT761_01745 [Atribacter laminatus]
MNQFLRKHKKTDFNKPLPFSRRGVFDHVIYILYASELDFFSPPGKTSNALFEKTVLFPSSPGINSSEPVVY